MSGIIRFFRVEKRGEWGRFVGVKIAFSAFDYALLFTYMAAYWVGGCVFYRLNGILCGEDKLPRQKLTSTGNH